MGLDSLDLDVRRYLAQLNAFLEHHRDLRHFVRTRSTAGQLIDHVAYKAFDSEGYERMREESTALGRLIGERADDGRRIAGVLLHKPVLTSIGDSVRLVALMEPRPGTHGSSDGGLDNAAFYVPAVGDVRSVLRKERITFQPEHAADYHWIAIEFGNKLELRFSNYRLRNLYE